MSIASTCELPSGKVGGIEIHDNNVCELSIDGLLVATGEVLHDSTVEHIQPYGGIPDDMLDLLQYADDFVYFINEAD